MVEDACIATRTNLSIQMNAAKDQLDPASLKRALKKTLIFERELGRIFGGDGGGRKGEGRGKSDVNDEEEEDSDSGADISLEEEAPMDQKEEGKGEGAGEKKTGKPVNRFSGIISKVFDDYMHIYTTLQEQDMKKMFDQILSEESWSLDAFNRKKVLSSSRDMVFYFSTSRSARSSFFVYVLFFSSSFLPMSIPLFLIAFPPHFLLLTWQDKSAWN